MLTRGWSIVLLTGVAVAGLCLGGCAGSSSTVIRLELTSRKAEAVNVMPFNTTFERRYYSDVSQRMGGLLQSYIVLEINRRSGLYTYTFDERDLANLRTTVLDSLTATGHYGVVNDVPTLTGLPPAGLRLYIDLESMGVSQKLQFICDIKARAKVTDERGAVLAERDIVVSERGTMTLSAAKNSAIEAFLREIEKLLNSV